MKVIITTFAGVGMGVGTAVTLAVTFAVMLGVITGVGMAVGTAVATIDGTSVGVGVAADGDRLRCASRKQDPDKQDYKNNNNFLHACFFVISVYKDILL